MIVTAIAKKYYSNDEYLRKMLLRGFWLKIFFSIIFVLLTQFYFGGGDTFMYYEFGKVLHNAITDNFQNTSFIFSGPDFFYDYVDNNTFAELDSGHVSGYMFGISNQIVVRISCILGFFCFQNFTVISLFFSMLSYIGVWKMFLLFYKIYPNYKKQIGISFLFLPSFLFWSSGLLKEALCLFGLGLAVKGFYNLFYFKERSYVGIIGAILGCYFLYLVKGYILFAFMASYFIMLFSFYTKKLNALTRFFFTILIITGIFLGFNIIVENFQSDASVLSAEQLIEQSKSFKDNYEDMGGAFVDIGDIDPSVFGIIKKIPLAITVVFLRPFPWEAKSIVLLMSMFESLFFLILFVRGLWKTKIYGFFSLILKNPIYLNCFVFSLFLGIIIGLTTFNFGTIIRYKIPCMPFFCMILLFVNAKKEKAKEVVNKH